MFIQLKQIYTNENGEYFTAPFIVSVESIVCVFPSTDYTGASLIMLSNGQNVLVDVNFNILQELIEGKLAEAKEKPESEWVPCEDILPAVDDDYIVALGINNKNGYSVDVDTFRHGRWKTYGKNVIAWMAFPAPYKKQSTD